MEISPLRHALEDLQVRTDVLRGIFDFANKKDRLTEVELELGAADVWNDPERAQQLGRERSSLEIIVTTIEALDSGIADAKDLLDMAVEEDDAGAVADIESEVEQLTAQLEKLEFRRMFSGEMDPNNAFLDIQAGSGGTEAQDWAEMLLRMYLRWGDEKGFKTTLEECSAGDVAGIKSATILLKVNMLSVGFAPRPACIGWCESHRLIPAIAAIPRSARCLFLPKSTTMWKLISILPTSVRIPIGPAEPVVSTSTRPIRRCA